MPDPLRRARGLLLLVSSVVALGAAELWVRFQYADEVDSEALRRVVEQVLGSEFYRKTSHPDLAYELRPGARLEWLGTQVAIDDVEPRRVAPDTREEPQSAVRLALVGDSTAFGWGVEWQDGYGERVRAGLQSRWGVRVVLRNYAVPGYNSHHNRVVLRERVAPWAPHLVILHYDHNDADPIQSEPHGFMPPEFGDNPLHSALIKWGVRRLHGWRISRFTSVVESEPGNPERFLHAYRYAGPQYERHMDELRAMAEIGRQHGFPILVLVFNAWLHATDNASSDDWYRLLHAPLDERLRSMGFSVVDVYEPAQQLMARRGWNSLRPLWREPRDPHPGPVGHAFLASVLGEAIQADPKLARALQGGAATTR